MHTQTSALESSFVKEWLANAPASLRHKIYTNVEKGTGATADENLTSSSSDGSLAEHQTQGSSEPRSNSNRRSSPSKNNLQQLRELNRPKLPAELPLLGGKSDHLHKWLATVEQAGPPSTPDILVVEHEEDAPFFTRTSSCGRRMLQLPVPAGNVQKAPMLRTSSTNNTSDTSVSQSKKNCNALSDTPGSPQSQQHILSRRRSPVHAAPMTLSPVRSWSHPTQKPQPAQQMQGAQGEAHMLPSTRAVRNTAMPTGYMRRATLADSLVPVIAPGRAPQMQLC